MCILENPRRHVVPKNTSQMRTIYTHFGRNLSACLYLYVSIYHRGDTFCSFSLETAAYTYSYWYIDKYIYLHIYIQYIYIYIFLYISIYMLLFQYIYLENGTNGKHNFHLFSANRKWKFVFLGQQMINGKRCLLFLCLHLLYICCCSK